MDDGVGGACKGRALAAGHCSSPGLMGAEEPAASITMARTVYSGFYNMYTKACSHLLDPL